MKFLFSLLLILTLVTSATAQLSKVDFDDTDVVFYGIDFTAARMIGSAGFSQPDSIVANFFDRWNSLLFIEQSKYDVAAGLNVTSVKYDLDPVQAHNKSVDPKTLVIDKSYTIDKDRVQEVISDLDMSISDFDSGQGFIFVVESFDKTQSMSFVWCTVFDIATKKVIATERFSGRAKGFGLRNYWGNTFRNVLKEVQGVTR